MRWTLYTRSHTYGTNNTPTHIHTAAHTNTLKPAHKKTKINLKNSDSISGGQKCRKTVKAKEAEEEIKAKIKQNYKKKKYIAKSRKLKINNVYTTNASQTTGAGYKPPRFRHQCGAHQLRRKLKLNCARFLNYLLSVIKAKARVNV